MNHQQRVSRLASLAGTSAGEALLESLNHRLDVFTQEMMTTNDPNAMFSARGAVTALHKLREDITAAPAMAETLRNNPPT